MIIINKSIRIINYENESVSIREIPDAFNEYINELVAHINSNTNVREYKPRPIATEVINCVVNILQYKDSEEHAIESSNLIANKLLTEEIKAQKLVERMNTNIQKGSLIQALLHDEINNRYIYLLAKVEHSDWVDDEDLSFKTGFSKDKKMIWKTCLLDLDESELEVVHARVYSNTVAKYWWDGFLELDEMINDESNTTKAFNAIEETLNRNIRRVASGLYNY